MRGIKPIETYYNGYRFRSRLEARWAVFFDSMGIRYKYEKEGFSLPSGPYLPDFWLPDWEIWFEVKGQFPTLKELHRLQDLCALTGYAACCSEGLPSDKFQGQCFVYSQKAEWAESEQSYLPVEDDEIKLSLCNFVISNYPDGDHEAWFFLDKWEEAFFYKNVDNSFVQYKNKPFMQANNDEEYIRFALSESFFTQDYNPIHVALKNAKSARFEFGESGV